MEITPKIKEQLDLLHEKFEAINQNTSTHLEGLLWAKPITYWDYIQTDALLSLQTQRTTLPDEMVFVMYHQSIECCHLSPCLNRRCIHLFLLIHRDWGM